MMNFTALFTNPKGLRLTVHFRNDNWFGVEEEARKVLDRDPQHIKYGPWTYQGSNVA